MPGWIDRLLGRESKSGVPRALYELARNTAVNRIVRDVQGLVRTGYERNAIVHRCVRLIAEAAASRTLASPGPAAQLLAGPNPDQSGPEFWESFYGHLILAGNAYVELSTLEGRPREMYVLRPDRVRAVPGVRGWPQLYEYRAGEHKRVFERDPVTQRSALFHMRLFSPADDAYGYSPLQAAAAALDLHNAGGRWAKSLLDNAARPSGALVVDNADGRLSVEQYERLKSELGETHSGPENAGRPMLLEGGLDWKPMSLTPADMDFVQARREAAREIALALGVPPLLLGLPGDNTYANYVEANQAFWSQTIDPLVDKTAAALTVWLRPWLGRATQVTAAHRGGGDDG
ncbi:phage portal protein [Maricaulis sp.]|uniref:phage portal protein n=1 Tax=Maricaulis sp. TaxID=1486257 RepID=UPI001B19D6DB|nr:phage portal protein [Maricaulis sp.]MBO6797146.1 phage portal protein [Maricaulis sp.]